MDIKLRLLLLLPMPFGFAVIWSKIPQHIQDADWGRYGIGMFLIILPAILFLLVRWLSIDKDNKKVGEFGTH